MHADSSRTRQSTKTALRKLHRDTTGAVFAEAVVMLPFFILVWGLILYVHSYYSRRITLGQQSKSCSWQYSNSGCQTVPDGCQRFAVSARGDFDSRDLGGERGSDFQEFISEVGSFVGRIVLGQNAVVNASAEVAKPQVIGGGRAQLRTQHAVMCNEVPTDPARIARNAFCRISRLCS